MSGLLPRAGSRTAPAPTERPDGSGKLRVAPSIVIERDAGHRSLPGLPHRFHPGAGPARVADDAAAAEVEKVERLSGPPIGLRRLTAPLTGADDRQGDIALGKDRRRHGSKRCDEAIVGLPIFGADAIDLELVD